MSPADSSGTLWSAARTMVAARSSGRTSLRDPLNARPMGERVAATTTASGTGPPGDSPWEQQRDERAPSTLPAGNPAAHALDRNHARRRGGSSRLLGGLAPHRQARTPAAQ